MLQILISAEDRCAGFVLHILMLVLGGGGLLQHLRTPSDQRNDLRPMLFVPLV